MLNLEILNTKIHQFKIVAVLQCFKLKSIENIEKLNLQLSI